MENLNPAIIKECSSPQEIAALFAQKGKVITLIDSNVQRLYGHFFPSPQIEIEATESNKTLEVLAKTALKLMEMEADRETFLLVAGGGILTDLGGFIASTYFRGIQCAFVPTTLLAQVDAALGGKNGVNLLGYKNIIGVTRQPEFTVLCPGFLNTLPLEEVKEGLAELLKTFIIDSRESYFTTIDVLKANRSILADKSTESGQESRDLSPLTNLIREAARIKTDITSHDLYENGRRKLLNLGHTFAHAIEKESGIPHGRAVAAGIILAAKLSVKLSLLDESEAAIIEKDFSTLGLETTSPVDAYKLAGAIKRDKKRSGGVISFILIEKIGKCIAYPLEISKLEEYLYDLC